MPSLSVANRACLGLVATLGAFLLAPALAQADDPTPAAVVVVPEDAALHVAWSPFVAADATISGYTVTATPAAPAVPAPAPVAAAADATDAEVTGLANGVAYTVTVAGIAADGTPLPAPTTPVAVPRTVPGQPVVTGIAGLDGSAQVSWTAPTDDGGAALTAYVVEASPTGASITVPAGARSAVVPELANGAAVAVQVAAVNDAGNGAPSVAVSTTPRKAARLVVTTPPKPVQYGSPSTVAAQVVSTRGAAVANARVELRGRAVGTSTWRTLATAVTNGQGRAALRTSLHVNTVLALHHATDGVVAADATVGTAGVTYRVTAPTRPRAVRVKHSVNVAGHIAPARPAGTKVQLQRWSAGSWRTVMTGRVQKRSNYLLTWTPRQPGAYTLRTITPHDARRSAGTSASWHQRVAPENAADIATEILHNPRITLADAHESGKQDSATALHNIRDVAAGRPARRSAYQNAPGGSTRLNLGLLRAVRAMGLRLEVTISEIAGGSHAVDSGHYDGRAVDVTVVNGRAIVGGGNYNVIAAICRANGATKVFDPGYDPVGGHANHVHCGWD